MKIAKMITAADVAGNCPSKLLPILVSYQQSITHGYRRPAVAARQMNLLKSTGSKNRIAVIDMPMYSVVYKHLSHLIKRAA
jgi:hypothetical protein